MKEKEIIKLNFKTYPVLFFVSLLVIIAVCLWIFGKAAIIIIIVFIFILFFYAPQVLDKLSERFGYGNSGFSNAEFYSNLKILKIDSISIPLANIQKISVEIDGIPPYDYFADRNDFIRSMMIYSTVYISLKNGEVFDFPVTYLFGLKKIVDLSKMYNIPVELPDNYKKMVLDRVRIKYFYIALFLVLAGAILSIFL